MEEFPGLELQGETLKEERENQAKAIQLILNANRQLAQESMIGKGVNREHFDLTDFTSMTEELGPAGKSG